MALLFIDPCLAETFHASLSLPKGWLSFCVWSFFLKKFCPDITWLTGHKTPSYYNYFVNVQYLFYLSAAFCLFVCLFVVLKKSPHLNLVVCDLIRKMEGLCLLKSSFLSEMLQWFFKDLSFLFLPPPPLVSVNRLRSFLYGIRCICWWKSGKGSLWKFKCCCWRIVCLKVGRVLLILV